MEGLGGQASWHYHYSGGAPGGYPSGNFVGWHIYTCTWEPGVINWYYDGILVGSQTSGVVSSPQYLILNYSINSSDTPSVPNTMLVDYVKVWQ